MYYQSVPYGPIMKVIIIGIWKSEVGAGKSEKQRIYNYNLYFHMWNTFFYIFMCEYNFFKYILYV